MSEELPEAVERVLQQFEAMAGAADWVLFGSSIRLAGEGPPSPRCPLIWMAGLDSWGINGTSDAMLLLGLSSDGDDGDENAIFYEAADGYGCEDFIGAHKAIRARLLAAAGLA
jgi:hypothetical protein